MKNDKYFTTDCFPVPSSTFLAPPPYKSQVDFLDRRTIHGGHTYIDSSSSDRHRTKQEEEAFQGALSKSAAATRNEERLALRKEFPTCYVLAELYHEILLLIFHAVVALVCLGFTSSNRRMRPEKGNKEEDREGGVLSSVIENNVNYRIL